MASHNDYSRQLGRMFDECPKTVIAAIAMSPFLNHQSDQKPNVAFALEWQRLHAQGIVKQPIGALARAAIAAEGGAT